MEGGGGGGEWVGWGVGWGWQGEGRGMLQAGGKCCRLGTCTYGGKGQTQQGITEGCICSGGLPGRRQASCRHAALNTPHTSSPGD